MKRIFPLIIILVGLLFDSIYVVPQGSYAVMHDKIINPGLHFKWPFIERAHYGSTLPVTLLADGSTESPFLTVQTFDKHNLEIGYQLVWQITDPITYYHATKQSTPINDIRAKLNDELGLRISQLTLAQLQQNDQQQTMLNHVLDAINPIAASKGIQLTSLLITSVNVASQDKTAWINQLKISQQENLDQLRQETSTLAQSLKANADQKANDIVEKAQAQADQIRTQGDLEATKIYTSAYNKDPAFYEFFHNLQMYKQLLTNKQDVLVFSTHTPFFKSMSMASQQNNDGKNG
jgi:membrane protease subunit HflC